MDVSFLIFLIPFFVLFVVCYVVSNRYWPAERKSLDKRLIVTAVLAGPMFYYLQGEEDRLVHHLESQGYTDVQIEHPNQWHCLRREGKYSYRARSPNGTPVHGGACVYFFIIETTEPIGEKYHRG
ncbi:MAG TPA: hypothetical protein VHF01_04820 [Candidatus Acidoferrum sp.]|nr:hypothetical protein [Candidatus Acidoferrum sp.]